MYTFKQAAESAEINENTARTYRDRYEDFFTYTGEGRRRRYAANTVDLLKFISEKVAAGLTQDQIRSDLERIFGVTVKLETQEHNITAPEDNNNAITQTEFIGLVRLAVAKELQSRDELIDELRTELQESRKAIEVLSASMEQRDLKLISDIRDIMDRKKKPWWSKVFGK